MSCQLTPPDMKEAKACREMLPVSAHEDFKDKVARLMTTKR